MPGVSLDTRWPSLSLEQKTSAKQQLIVLRAIPHISSTPLGHLGRTPQYVDFRQSICTSSISLRGESDFNEFLLERPLMRVSKTCL